jgi:hypothetical protein
MSIKDILKKWKKDVSTTANSSIGGHYDPALNTVTAPAPTWAPPAGPTVGVTGSVLTTGASYGTWNIVGSGAGGAAYINPNTYSISYGAPPTDIMKLQNFTGKEIVKLTQEGKVIWTDPEMNEDEAAQAFGRSMQYSAELKAGITKTVKSQMRDTVFEEIINIAKQKGSLTADDLTYLLEASKIIEKLKGG